MLRRIFNLIPQKRDAQGRPVRVIVNPQDTGVLSARMNVNPQDTRVINAPEVQPKIEISQIQYFEMQVQY